MAGPTQRIPQRRTRKGGLPWSERMPLVALLTLVVAAFLLGGGARGDITSLVILRPLAVACLGYGLYGLTREKWRTHRGPLVMTGLIALLIAIHLVPLPPPLWNSLPGRGIVIHGDTIAGLEGVWRPISLVPHRGWNSLWAMTVPAAALVLLARTGEEERWLVLRVIVALALASALLGLLQTVSGNNPLLYPYRVTNGNSPVGLLANKNHQAAMLCAVLPLLALVAVRAEGAARTTVRFVCAGMAALVVLVLLATGSRGGLAFLVVAAIGTAAIYWRAGLLGAPGPGTRRWLVPALGVGGLVAIIIVSLIFARAGALERVAGADSTEESRLAVWQVTAGVLPDYLPLGSGIGSFVEVFAMNEPAEMLSLNYWNHAHNDVLEWLLEGGIPAAILIVAAVVLWFRATRAVWRRLPFGEPAVMLGATGSLIAFILGLWSLVDYPLRVPSLAVLFVIAAVWLNRVQTLGGDRQTNKPSSSRAIVAGD